MGLWPAEPDPRSHGHDDENRQEGLEQHRAVAHRMGVEFAPQLLARGARAHKAVEAADGTAGDRDEQEGDDWRRVGRMEIEQGGHERERLPRGGADRRAAEAGRGDESEHDQSEARHELEAIDVVPRLEQHPHRQHARHVAVGQEHGHPGPHGPGRYGGVEPLDRRPQAAAGPLEARATRAEPDGGEHDGKGGEARPEQSLAGPMHLDPDPDGDRDLKKHRQRRFGKLHEHAGDHPAEDREHHPEREEEEHEKQEPNPAVEQPAGDLSYRHAPVAKAHHERGHVVHGADKDRAQEHPDHGRPPAPHDRERRPHDRPGAGDAREVVAEHDRRRRGHVVDVVAEFHARHRRVRAEPEHHPSEPVAVGEIGADEQGDRREDEEQDLHGGNLALRRAAG